MLAGRAAEIDRHGHIVDALGEPSACPAGRERWREAAAAIESYRARWGAGPGDAITVPAVLSREQHDHLEQVEQQVARAVQPLDMGDQPPALELG